jgi:hypothetical protein
MSSLAYLIEAGILQLSDDFLETIYTTLASFYYVSETA